MHLYSALLCIAVHPKCSTIMWGGLSSTTTSVQHPLGWCKGCHRTTAPVRSPHTSSTCGEERESKSQSSGWGLLGGHDWQAPVEGIWPGHWGYTPTLYEKCHTIFNDHKESGPQFNVSSERRCFFDSYSVKGPTQTAGWAPHAGLTNTSSSCNLVFTGGLPSRY